jgi:hypothetical protein
MLYSEVLKSNKKAKFELKSREAVALTNSLCDEFVAKYGNSPGIKPTKDKLGYQYNLGSNFMNTDPAVRKAMKIYDRSMYDSIKGYSKSPDLALTLDTLSKYSRYQADKRFRSEKEIRCWKRAIALARQKFQFEDLIAYDNTPVLQEMEKSTAAGFSFPGKKKSEVIDQIGSIAAYMRHNIQDDRFVYVPPAKLAQRGHLHDAENPKSRPVWVVPAEIIVLEGKFAIPYIDRLKSTKTVLIGENSMYHLIQLLNGIVKDDDTMSASIDWSAFDSSLPNWLIDEAFKIIKNSFNLGYTFNLKQGVHTTKKKGKDEKAKAENSAIANGKLFDWLTTNFKKTKIMLPNGTILKKMHGIPSGSYFTQAVGSICNYIVVCFLMYMMGIEDFDVHVLGDDSYTRFTGSGFDLQLAADLAWKYFKMKLNVKKSSVKNIRQPQKFLGYETQGERLVRSDEEFAKMVLYPERDVLTLEQSFSRVFAYYLLGGVNNAWYCKFYHHFLGYYSKYKITHFTLHPGIYRTLRYVAGLDVRPFQNFVFDPGTLSSMLIAYHFRFVYGIYQSDLQN